YFAGFGWRTDGLNPPAADTVWTASAPVLRPGQPVTLTAANATGQQFRIVLSVDKDYMFTVQQTVANGGNAPVPVAAYGYVNRGISADPDTWTIHVGPMSVNNGSANYGPNWKDVDKAPTRFSTTGGWLGFTDKYWLTALIPDQA
ncbi:membrane protein insertase YidC, partial [Serratia marcescens]